MDELEWLRKNSPPANPSRDTTQRHRTQLRAAIATEGADGPRPRRPRRRLRSRHRVLVTSIAVVVLCLAGAGVIALTSGGGDENGKVAAPAASGSTSTTTAPSCSGPLPVQFNIPSDFGTAVAGPAKEASDPVDSGQQVMHWSSGKATFETRWPANAKIREQFGVIPQPQRPGDTSGTVGSDIRETVDDNGIVHRRAVASLPGQVPECQSIEITIYGTDTELVNSLANAFTDAPIRSTQPLVNSTKAAATAPLVTPCPGPADNAGAVVLASETKFTPTIGGTVSAATFTKPEAALGDFLADHRTLFQRGYQELQLDDGSLDFIAEPRPGVVVTVVHVTATTDGWTVSDWSASGC